MNYQLVKGPDNTVWVSLQPLMQDVKSSLEKLEVIDTSELSTLDKDIMEFNMLGMKAIYTFLGALLQESNDKEILNANTDRQTTH